MEGSDGVKMSALGNPPPYSEVQQEIPVATQPTPGITRVVAPGIVAVASDQHMEFEPTLVVCKSCHFQILTRVEVRATMRTHFWALCCFFTGFWPCICVPYCLPGCMAANHYCPNCGAFVGSNHRQI